MVCSSVKWYDSLSQEGTKQSAEPGQQGSGSCGCRFYPQQASSCLLFGIDCWLVESRLLSLGLCFLSQSWQTACFIVSAESCHAHAHMLTTASHRPQAESSSLDPQGSGRSSRSARATFHINNNKLNKNQLKIFTESLVTSGYLVAWHLQPLWISSDNCSDSGCWCQFLLS